MANKYYTELLDDAQTFIGMAQKKLEAAKDVLRESRSPAHMLAATPAKRILMDLMDSQSAIDELPSDCPAPVDVGITPEGGDK